MKSPLIALFVVLGLAAPARAELTWWESARLWWAKGSLESARWWRDHHEVAEYGLGFMQRDLDAAVLGRAVDGACSRDVVERLADVEQVPGRFGAAGWWLKGRGAVRRLAQKRESGGYGGYVKSDVTVHALDGLQERLAVDLFGPTERGRASARAEAASLYDDAARGIAEHLAHVRSSRRRFEREVRELEAKVRALEAKRGGGPVVATALEAKRGGRPVVATAPAARPAHAATAGPIQLLGVR